MLPAETVYLLGFGPEDTADAVSAYGGRMSVAVSIDELHEHAAAFGERALLITTNEDGRPHVTSVVARVGQRYVTVGGGRQTRANALVRPHVTLVWPGEADDSYCLIVDGVADTPDDTSEMIAIEPMSAILHRLADADSSLPSCVRLDDGA
jgi:hypothetical protein